MLSVLIGERKVRDFFSRRGHMKCFRAVGGRLCSMASDLDVFQPVVGIGVLVARVVLDHHDIGGNRVSRGKLAQHRHWLDLVRHHHRFHESLDQVAIDTGGLRLVIDGDDPAGKVVALSGLRFGTMAGSGYKG